MIGKCIKLKVKIMLNLIGVQNAEAFMVPQPNLKAKVVSYRLYIVW